MAMQSTEGGSHNPKVTEDKSHGPKGIPKAVFIDDVYSYLSAKPQFSSDPKLVVEDSLLQLQEFLSKYKFMFTHQSKKFDSISSKIPEIEKSIDAIRLIKKKFENSTEPATVDYELGDTLYAKATIKQTKTVFLWLGASILMSYDVDEAIDLLSSKLASSLHSILELENEMGFLREQITTVEVNISRIYNWHVKNQAK